MNFSGKCVKILCVVLAMLLCLPLALPAFAQEEEVATQSVVVSYGIADKESIKKDEQSTLAVQVRNLKMKTEQCSGVDITRTVDSFKNGTASAKITSKKGELLEYTVTFTNVVYTGKGQNLSFVVLYKGTDCETETLSVTIEECVEYVAPETTKKTTAAPVVLINRDDLTQLVKPGTSFAVDVLVNNTSNVPIYNAIAVLEPGEGVALEESKISKTVGTVAPHTVAVVTVGLKALKGYSVTPLSLGVNLKYAYDSVDGMQEGVTEEKLLMPISVPVTTAKTKTASATPNIIVTSYSYGGASVAAGDTFDLSVTYQNTSKTTAAENIVMAVQTGENLSITSASNTYYISSLKAGESKTQTIEMRVPANAAVTGAKTDITFNYEYVSGGERASATANESLSIPVYLPDRFSVTEPEALFATAGEEVTLSVPYVNRGKGEIGNVEAKIVFDDPNSAVCEEPKQILGNFEAGKSGTVDFFFTPAQAGALKCKVVIAYEDEMTQPKQLELPLTVTVEESMIDDMGGDIAEEPIEEETQGARKWIIIGAVIGGLVLVAVVITVVVLKKKKKAALAVPESFDWSDSTDTEQR